MRRRRKLLFFVCDYFNFSLKSLKVDLGVIREIPKLNRQT